MIQSAYMSGYEAHRRYHGHACLVLHNNYTLLHRYWNIGSLFYICTCVYTNLLLN